MSEAGRTVCEEVGLDNMQKRHYFEILFRHKELEIVALDTANKVLLIDTDSLITLYYYQLSYGCNDNDFNNLASLVAKLNNYDLYLFLEPDVEWVQDGTRTYGEQSVREENNKKLKKIFDENNIKYISISGDYDTRFNKAKKLVKELIKEHSSDLASLIENAGSENSNQNWEVELK